MSPSQTTTAIAEKAPCPTEAECLRILRLAGARAFRAGLTGEDAEDCALACLLPLLDQATSGFIASRDWNDAWRFRCIDNWARNAARQERRRIRRRVPLFINREEKGPLPQHVTFPDSIPESLFLTQERAERLFDVVARLLPQDRELIRAHFLDLEGIATLSVSAGCSEEAMRQRQRLESFLRR